MTTRLSQLRERVRTHDEHLDDFRVLVWDKCGRVGSCHRHHHRSGEERPVLGSVVLWLVWWVTPDREESSFGPDSIDEFSSTASGEGLTNDCSEGALPDPGSSNNPELNCVLPLDNEIGLLAWRAWKA